MKTPLKVENQKHIKPKLRVMTYDELYGNLGKMMEKRTFINLLRQKKRKQET
jgi:hypothetical protein